MDGVQKEFRRTLTDEGWLVEEFPIGSAVNGNQSVIPAQPKEPPREVTIKDVPLDLATAVVKDAGLLVVPASFLNETQLADLGIDTGTIATPPDDPVAPAGKLPEADAIAKVKAAASFEELNALTADETRAKVLAAAEQRAAELKEQGK